MILWSEKIYPFYFHTVTSDASLMVTSNSSLNSAQEFILQHNYLCKCVRYQGFLRKIVGYPTNTDFWAKIILLCMHSFCSAPLPNRCLAADH